MHKIWTRLLAVLLLVLVALPAGAQEEDENWSAYLFSQNESGGALLKIDNDGTQTEYTLDIPQNSFANPRDFAFTPDGDRVAYCLTVFPPPVEGATDGPQLPSAEVIVRDLEAGENVLMVDLGEVPSCVASAISDDGALLAVGTLNYFPNDPNTTAEGPLWTLRILDTATGEAVATLTDDDPAGDAVYLFDAEFDPILPRATRLSAERVSFQAYPGVGMGGPLEVPAFQWDISAGIDAGAVTAQPALFSLNNDILEATGEVVAPAVDSNLPMLEPGGPILPYNTVTLTSVEGETRTIYSNTELIIGSTTFVNDGEAIALVMIPPFNPDMPQQQATTVGLIDREGNYTAVGDYIGFVVAVAAPGGFLLNYDVPQTDAPPTLYLEYHRADGTIIPLWEYSATPDSFNFWQLATVLG